MCDKPATCTCRSAVTRAYGELRQRDVSEIEAFDAAITLYRIYHPEVPLETSRDTIADWLDAGA